jgi:hypothetical protein
MVGLFSSCTQNVEVEIFVGEESKRSIETVAGASFSLNARIVKGNKNQQYIWAIDGEALGCEIAPNGGECVVKVGVTAGDMTVSVKLKSDGKKSDSIVIHIKDKTLQSISIAAAPSITAYTEGQFFNPDGMVVLANYENFSVEITDYAVDIKRSLSLYDAAVTVSYTEKTADWREITKTASVQISVSAKILTGIEITAMPNKTEYKEGEYFDFLGLAVTAHYSNGLNAVVYGWVHNKPNALTADDTEVTITYTEGGLTESASFTIVVNAAEVISPESRAVIEIIDALPDLRDIMLANADAVAYAEELYATLTSSQQAEVTNVEKLRAAAEKIAELIAAIPPEPEPEYAVSYNFYGDLVFSDIDFGGNPTEYKNSGGAAALNPASSEEATAQGYYFARWIDADTLGTVTEISDINGDKAYLAVFELTATVSIAFFDYADRETELLRLPTVNRRNSDGSYAYNLNANGIEAAIFSGKELLAIAYYVVLGNGTPAEVESGRIYLDYGAVITVYAITAATRTITIEPEFDGNISWDYEYTNGNGDERSVHRFFNSGTRFYIPVGARVTVYAANSFIKDIIVDGVKAGLLYPARQHNFTLLDGEDAVVITFEYYIADIVSITFSGVNTRVYTYAAAGWNGHLSAVDLDNIAFMFDEENDFYLNRYVIDGEELFYSDLAEYTFDGNTLVTVNRASNRFSFTINYPEGKFTVGNLVGKQTLEAAFIAKEYGTNAEFTELLDGILDSAALYSDEACQNAIAKADILSENLIDNVIIYAVWKTAFTIDFDTAGGSNHAPITVLVSTLPESIYGRLSERLPIPTLDGYIFAGWAVVQGGEAVSAEYIDTVIRVSGEDITLYAVFAPEEIVDYSGDFIGDWSAVYNGNSGIVSANLTLSQNGTYVYETFINGVLSVSLSGTYGVADSGIEILTLTMQGEYQLIAVSDFKINTEFSSDNLLVVTMFELNGMTLSEYDRVLTKGEVRPANYIGNENAGRYELTVSDNGGVEQSTVITLYENGEAEVFATVKENGEIIYGINVNCYWRIASDGRIWILSNDAFGVFDATDTLSICTKS